jgi:DNA-binding beta-propeller fold protein YncE
MLANRLKTALSSVEKAWNISKAVFNGGVYGQFSVAAQEATPTGIFFKPDGTKMYVLGSTGDDVNEYNLSTPWNITTASYLQNFSVAAQEAVPTGIFFKPDGTKMYVLGSIGDDVNEYNLSTPWNIATASYLQNFSVAAQEAVPTGIFFKPDGTKMYLTGTIGRNVNEYNLSTPWNIATASYLQVFSVAAQETNSQSVFFKPDGTKMYVLGIAGNDVNEYNLSTPWNIATASYLQNFSVITEDAVPRCIFFKPDGTKMYILGISRDIVNEYNLSIPWDVSTASWISPAQDYFNIFEQETNSQSVFFKPDGTKMYVLGIAGDDVNEYNLSTPWNIATASYLQVFSVAAQETFPTGIFFKPDGTKMYVLGNTGDDVNEYNLSTPWNIATASYLQVFSVAAQETFPTGIFFKPDGTKMYLTGTAGRDVNEYNLSTPWNIATASYLQVFSVAAQGTSPTDIFFKPDGTKMYVSFSSNIISEYNLSTAWDINTASYKQDFNVSFQLTAPQGIFFKPDGTKMYIIGSGGNIWAYSL